MKYVINLIARTFRVLVAKFGLWLFRKAAKKVEAQSDGQEFTVTTSAEGR